MIGHSADGLDSQEVMTSPITVTRSWKFDKHRVRVRVMGGHVLATRLPFLLIFWTDKIALLMSLATSSC